MEFLQVRTWDLVGPGSEGMDRFRSWLSQLDAKFKSWKTSNESDDILCSADPELVAALEFLASLLADKEEA